MKYSIAAMVLVGLASAEQLKQSEEPKPKDAQNELGGVTGGAEPKKADAAPKDKKEGEGAKPEGDAKKEGGDAKKSDAKDGDKKTEAKDGDKKAESA